MDNPTINMSRAGSYTRTFYSPNNISIGSVKLIVSPSTKETPTITLTSDASSSTTSNNDVRFVATLSKTGAKDLNNNATVIFKDGTSTLQTVTVTNDKAELTTKLPVGNHSIIAQYSGNSDFETVSSTAIPVEIKESTKKEQTIGFHTNTVSSNYGDILEDNALIQSEEHGNGTITYTSSDENIARVDTSGKVTVFSTGTVVITATIAEDDTFLSASGNYTIEIMPKEVTLQDLEVQDKVYDGSDLAQATTSRVSLSGVLAEDIENLNLQQGTLHFASSNAGTHKIEFKDFTLEGNASKNYTLIFPDIQANITKVKLRIVAIDQSIKQGDSIPQLTYLITGFVANENETTITGYHKPTLSCNATSTSTPGDYVIIASDAIADNYTFEYVDGTLTIEAVSPSTTLPYSVKGTLGKNGWYVSNVILEPSNGYDSIWDGTSWKRFLTLEHGIYENKEIKFQTADGVESDLIKINLKIDTIKPSIHNIKDGEVYFMNRAFSCEDEFLSVVKVNGESLRLSAKDWNLIGDQEKQQIIHIEDEAGNVTSITVNTKELKAIDSDVANLTLDNVTSKDEDRIREVLKQTENLLQDASYSPSDAQLQKLKAQKENCEALLAALQKTTSNPVDDIESPSPTSKTDNTTTSPQTGDVTTFFLLVTVLILSSSSIILLQKFKKSN